MAADQDQIREKVFLRYFVVIMVLIGLVGMMLWFIGVNSKIDLLSTLGLALFSSGTVGLLFKYISLDTFLNVQLRDTLIGHGYISQLSSDQIAQALDTQFRELARRRGLPESASMLFKEAILDKIKAPHRDNMKVKIILERRTGKGRDYLWATETVRYDQNGQAGNPVFPNNVLQKDCELQIPAGLMGEPFESVYRFVNLKVNGREVRARVVDQSIVEDGPRRGRVQYSVSVEENLNFSGESLEIEYREEYALDLNDITGMIFLYYTRNIEVDCYHPKTTKIYGNAFLSSVDYVETPGETLYTLRSKAAALPGNGVLLFVKESD